MSEAMRRELTPGPRLTYEDEGHARTAFDWALRCEALHMTHSLEALPRSALPDVVLAAELVAATAEALLEQKEATP